MSWLDTLLDRGMQAIESGEPEPVPRPRQPKPDIKSIWIQTRAPRAGDPGSVEPAYYFVADGVVTMCDESGKSSGNEYQLGPADDAHSVAGRLAREKAAPTNINRRLQYPNTGWK
jgi:hypothetical protein